MLSFSGGYDIMGWVVTTMIDFEEQIPSLYKQMYAHLFRVADRTLNDPDLAADMVQNAFL